MRAPLALLASIAFAPSLALGFDEDDPRLACERTADRRDEAGRLLERACVDAAGKPTVAEDGVSSLRVRRDGSGRETGRAYLGADGAPVKPSASRWAARTTTWSEDGRRVDVVLRDRKGAPMPDADGCVTVVERRDASGRLVERACHGPSGRPAIAGSTGAAIVRHGYDEPARAVETSWFDGDNAPILVRGCHALREVRDERGAIVSTACLGPDRSPRRGIGGWHRRELRRLDGGVLEERLLDVDGKPILGRDGWAIRRETRDARGRSEVRWFQPDGIATTVTPREPPLRVAVHGLREEPTPGGDARGLVRIAWDTMGRPLAGDARDAEAGPFRWWRRRAGEAPVIEREGRAVDDAKLRARLLEAARAHEQAFVAERSTPR